jgi:hypothetical protein
MGRNVCTSFDTSNLTIYHMATPWTCFKLNKCDWLAEPAATLPLISLAIMFVNHAGVWYDNDVLFYQVIFRVCLSLGAYQKHVVWAKKCGVYTCGVYTCGVYTCDIYIINTALWGKLAGCALLQARVKLSKGLFHHAAQTLRIITIRMWSSKCQVWWPPSNSNECRVSDAHTVNGVNIDWPHSVWLKKEFTLHLTLCSAPLSFIMNGAAGHAHFCRT